MKAGKQKAIRDLNAAIRDLRGARVFVSSNRFENDDQEIRQALNFVEGAINQMTTLKVKDSY